MLPGNRIRIQPSGCANRKRKDRQDELVKSQTGDMLKYVTRRKTAETDETFRAEMNREDGELPIEEDEELVTEENADARSAEEFVRDDGDGINENREQVDNENREDHEKAEDIKGLHENVDMDDPGNWGKIEQRMRDFLVEKGPPKRPPTDYPFPRDDIDRCFTYSCYTRKMSNGEKQDRRWLVYSKAKDKIFCFCCKLFTQDTNPPILVTSGYDDWRNASQRLKTHETTHHHMVIMSRWIELEIRLKKGKLLISMCRRQLTRRKSIGGMLC